MPFRPLFLVMLACAATAANAGTLLTEDFAGATSGTYGVGTIAGTQFAVTTANVDLGGALNGGGFFACSGNPAGNCVDLVGNGGGGGIASIRRRRHVCGCRSARLQAPILTGLRARS